MSAGHRKYYENVLMDMTKLPVQHFDRCAVSREGGLKMGKIGIRCKVCDGPVANGRCKLCGMPYKNDETLYHLNENRREHYTHATPAARQILREAQIPLGDKKSAAGSTAEKGKRVSGVSSADTVGSAASNNKKTYYSSGTTQSRKTSVSRMSGVNQKTNNTAEKKKISASGSPKKSRRLLSAIVVISILISLVPNIVDRIREEYYYRHYTYQQTDPWETEYGTGEIIEDLYTADSTYYLTPEDGLIEVGDWCPEGYYRLYVKDGFAKIKIHGEDSMEYNVTEAGIDWVELREGDLVNVTETDMETRLLRMDLLSEGLN